MDFLFPKIKEEKEMKKNIIIGLGAALLLALGGCAQKDNSAEASDGQKTIGVLQLVQHNSLDAA